MFGQHTPKEEFMSEPITLEIFTDYV